MRYLPGYKVQDGIAQRLANVMHSHLKWQDGGTWAPNLYTIIGHPSALMRWHNQPRLLEELSTALYTAGNDAGFQFSSKPSITTSADTGLPIGELKIIASFSSENVEETVGSHPPQTPASPSEEKVPSNAFLIIGGTQIVPLDRTVINIGRRLDNHIVIDDPRISRAHAQLRIVKGRFVLFDLDSSGGTFVNGQRTNQSVLYSGDVISLAGVTLIFGQDSPTRSPNEDKTGPISPASSDRPTAILRREDFLK